MATGSMTTSAVRPTSVNESMGDLDCAIQVLAEKIVFLKDRLNPITSNNPSIDKPGPKAMPSKNCELASKIQMKVSEIQGLNDKINSILEGLEI